MPLHNPSPITERILDIGPANAGKTSHYLHIAALSQASGSDAQFYVQDTDHALPRMLSSPSSSYLHLTNIHPYSLSDWPSYRTALNRILSGGVCPHCSTRLPAPRPQDWVICDLAGSAWRDVQKHFTHEVFHQDMGDYFLEARKALKAGAKQLQAFQGWTDWSVINPMYSDWIDPLIDQDYAFNVFFAAGVKILDAAGEKDEQVKAMFNAFGMRPDGQKDLPHQFHTVLVSSTQGVGKMQKWYINTAKDRERERLQGVQVINFARDYLMRVAGWSL